MVIAGNGKEIMKNSEYRKRKVCIDKLNQSTYIMRQAKEIADERTLIWRQKGYRKKKETTLLMIATQSMGNSGIRTNIDIPV